MDENQYKKEIASLREEINELREEIKDVYACVIENEGSIMELDNQLEAFKELTGEELLKTDKLQRKDVWSKKQVCDYFDISAKTFERWRSSGEIRVVKVGGKDFCRLIDLKDRFRDRGEDLPTF